MAPSRCVTLQDLSSIVENQKATVDTFLKKKLPTNNFLQRGTPPDEAVDSYNDQPHIVVFIEAQEEPTQLDFIAVKGQPLVESTILPTVLFLCLGAH